MSTISAGTTISTALVSAGDTTGALVFKTGASATTAMTINADQSVTFAGSTNITPSTFTAQSSATNITLTTVSSGFQLLSFTAANLAVILPAATAYTALGQKFNIRNAGANAFKIQNSSGKTIYWVKPNAVAQVFLKSNTGTSNNWEIFTGDIESDNGLAWLGTKLFGLSSSDPAGVSNSLTAMLAPDLFYFQWRSSASVEYGYIAQEYAENTWSVKRYTAAGLIPEGSNYGKGTAVDGTSFYWGTAAGTTIYLVNAERASGAGTPTLTLTNTLTLTGLNTSYTVYSHSTSLQLASGLIPTSYNPGICVISGVGGAATVTSAQSIVLGTNASSTKVTDAIMFDATNGMLYMYDNTLQTHYFKLFNLTGTAITYVGTTRTIIANTEYDQPNLRLAKVSATEALFYYELTASTGTHRAVKIVFDPIANDISITSYDLTSTYDLQDEYSADTRAAIYNIFSKGMVILYNSGSKLFLQKLTLDSSGVPKLSGAMRTDLLATVENSTSVYQQALDTKCDAFAVRYTEQMRQSSTWEYIYFHRILLVNDKD